MMILRRLMFAFGLLLPAATPYLTYAQVQLSLEEAFIERLSPCEAYEFGSKGLVSRHTNSFTIALPAALRELTEEWNITRLEDVGRLPKDISPSNARDIMPIPYHPGIVAALRMLASEMRIRSAPSVSFARLQAAADRKIARLAAAGEPAHCYRVFTFNAIMVRAQTIAINPAGQNQIAGLFGKAHDAIRRGHYFFDAPLSEHEFDLLNSGVLHPDELMELRALRNATGLFEKMTPLKHDFGGWTGNLLSEAIPLRSNQMNCVAETETFRDFVQALIDQDLLRMFKVERAPVYRSRLTFYHLALHLRNLRTGKLFVLDSWHENGGVPAHITTLEDWLKRNDHADVSEVLKAD